MAEIQMEYIDDYCGLGEDKYCGMCASQFASDVGCHCFDSGYDKNEKTRRIPYGNCIHSKFKTKYKGMSTKSYEMEEDFCEEYGDHYMFVTIRGKVYQCSKVILDGVCVYPRQPE